MEKVCVLMSTYNGEKYLEEQLDSILNQKGKFLLDILVRDDGSTDDTINILKKYEKNNYIKWYSGENLKPAKSFWNLLMNASDEYDFYLFADQDDYWYDNKIQNSIDKLPREVPAIYYSNPEIVNHKLELLGKKVYKKKTQNDLYSIICGCNIIGCTMCFNNALFNIVHKKNMPQKILMHDSYLARICVSIGGKIVYDDNSYMKYRQHNNNTIGINYKVKDKIVEKIHDIYTKALITIDEQIGEILKTYCDNIVLENKKFLLEVSNYRKKKWYRIRLACSMKVKYNTLGLAIKYRIAILLGNR